MRLTVLGGGGFRVPLVHGALLAARPGSETRAGSPVRELVLQDVDAGRLDAVRRVLEGQAAVASVARPPRITVTTDLETAVRGADVVFSAIRPGGLAGRAADERRAVAAGVLGQETTGAAGILYGLRSVPASLRIADAVARLAAPDAWIIDFTNPAGLVTEAMAAVLGDRVIGICDSPAGLCRRVARVLGVPYDRVWFDYAGLNHLGWLTGAHVGGRDLLPTLLADDALVASFEEGRLFGGPRLRALGAVPNEYLAYWYDRSAVDPQHPTRGELLLGQQEAFYAAAADDGPDAALRRWDRTRQQREETYLAEHRSEGEARDEDDLSGGYEGIALALLEALTGGGRATLVLNVRNRSALPGLDADAVVEVPCLVDANGAHPLVTGGLGAAELALVRTVKQVDRLTIEAARTGDRDLAVQALALHPLVGPRAAEVLAPAALSRPG